MSAPGEIRNWPVADVRLFSQDADMSGFEVIRKGLYRDAAFTFYLYEIHEDGRRVAEFRHSHRNEDHQIRRSSLTEWEEFDDILEGGGPQPLRVSASGADALSQYLAKKSNV
jgi:hypothetical protein